MWSSGEYGVCLFSDGTACDEWALQNGECAEGDKPVFATYCADAGGELSNEDSKFAESDGAPIGTYEVCTVDGAKCAAYDYYTSGCADFPTTSDSPSLGGGGTIGSPNPSSVGCADKGGTSETLYDNEGGQYGVCLFSDGTACEEWALQNGECAEGDKPVFATYCTDIGGDMSNESVTFVSEGNPPATYEVCTLDGAKCAAYDYYTSGCADFPATATSEGVSSLPPTPASTPTVTTSSPVSGATAGAVLGAFFNVGLFGAIYFAI
jgi:putative hemolysin